MGLPADRGILAVDKEAGPTSHDVVAAIRRLTGIRRVGHCGTLDPLATGVLVVCYGRFTRLADWIAGGDKAYEATFVLGVDSATGDGEGPLTERRAASPPARPALEEALSALRGSIEQVPPAHSAVKVGGVPSYRLARRARPVGLEARTVQVYEFEVTRYEYPDLEVRVGCSKGTYIRSLARDLGQRLGCGAYVARLRRLRVGSIGLERARRLVDLAAALETGTGGECILVPPRQALDHLGALDLGADEARIFAHGGQIARQAPSDQLARAVYGPDGDLLGIAEAVQEGDAWRPRCVVADAEGC